MSQWCSVEQQTGLSVYFCDPRSPWQRATNEHTNGMLRRWLPKSTNLNIGQIPLSIIEDNLNLMPRRLQQLAQPPRPLQSTNEQPPLELAILSVHVIRVYPCAPTDLENIQARA